MVSRQLRMADLGPLIGVDSGSGHEKPRRRRRKRSAARKAASPLTAYCRMTASIPKLGCDGRRREIQRQAHRTQRLAAAQRSLYPSGAKNGDLLLDPLRFGVAGGTLNSTVRLEGSRTPMRGRADLHARKLHLRQLFPGVEAMQNSLGQLNGDATLSGTGNSVADLLATSNGDVKLLMNDGVISRSLMEIIGLNVGNYVVGKLFGDDEVRINCAAANLDVRNGLATSRLFVFDTTNAVVNLSGNVNFANERMDLSINPESKGVRIVTLRSPLYVRGTFKTRTRA